MTIPEFPRVCRRLHRVMVVFCVCLMVVVICLYYFLATPSPQLTHTPAEAGQPVAEPQAPLNGPKEADDAPPPINYNAHIFYYTWYGNPRFNGRYIHWNHPRLPHWNRMIGQSYSTATHLPPGDIGASFYPQLGLYSFLDSTVIEEHFSQIRNAGIGVVVLSWYPPHMADGQGVPNHYIVPRILDFAAKFALKVALHIEPYAKRDATNLRRHLRYLVTQNITSHRAYYRINSLPVFYIYDSYFIKWNTWARLLTPQGDLSVRRSEMDGYFIGLYKLTDDCHRFADAGFNGAYSYFAVDGFTPGSRISTWSRLVSECRQRGIEFIPCPGPGYDDTAVRPWNDANVREREDGQYYRVMFESAINSGAHYVAITSFNEWHEGTQIEPAVPKKWEAHHRRTYKDYQPNPPDFYLHLTRALVSKFAANNVPT